MIAISTTELRRNLRKYLNTANKERVIIQCGKSETYEIIPARKMSDNVVEHLQHSRSASRGGENHCSQKIRYQKLPWT